MAWLIFYTISRKSDSLESVPHTHGVLTVEWKLSSTMT
jgi:hypothetical protein